MKTYQISKFHFFDGHHIAEDIEKLYCKQMVYPSRLLSNENIFELSVDAGAIECFSNEKFHEIHCDKNEIYNVKKYLEQKIKNFISTDICWIPLNSVEIKAEKLKLVLDFLNELEQDDDIQHVYTNLNYRTI